MEQADQDRDEAQQPGREAASRPQRAGEAATTRFGMEEGDNTDVPATGEGLREEDEGGEGQDSPARRSQRTPSC